MLDASVVPRDTARYLQQIRRLSMLEPDEESMLARRWREHGDSNAAQKLVTSHLRLVAKIATGYRGYGLPISDLISEGNVGLMQAVKRFNPEKGVRFASYAIWWIKATPGKHSALVVAGANRHHCKSEEAEYNVSRERVRQLGVRAFEKVQKLVKTHISRSARHKHVSTSNDHFTGQG